MLFVREIVREIVFAKGLVLEKEFECEDVRDISIFSRRYLGLSNIKHKSRASVSANLKTTCITKERRVKPWKARSFRHIKNIITIFIIKRQSCDNVPKAKQERGLLHWYLSICQCWYRVCPHPCQYFIHNMI